MNDWSFVSIDKGGIDIKLNFADPVSISSGDQPDVLVLQLDLGGIKGANGNNMPTSVVKYLGIPT